jgi:hypothetical protein
VAPNGIMGSMKISVTISLAAVCLIVGANTTRAETRYFWTDAEGEHYTRDKPRMVTPYTQVSIPDTVAWRSPPVHTEGSTEGAALPAQDLFKKVAQSVYCDLRTGSEERARATQRLYRHRRKTYQIAWENSKSFCTPILRRW